MDEPNKPQFQPSQCLLLFFKDVWGRGKRLPFLDNILCAVENSANHAIRTTTKADLKAIENALVPQLKDLDNNILEPAFSSCFSIVGSVVSQVFGYFEGNKQPFIEVCANGNEYDVQVDSSNVRIRKNATIAEANCTKDGFIKTSINVDEDRECDAQVDSSQVKMGLGDTTTAKAPCTKTKDEGNDTVSKSPPHKKLESVKHKRFSFLGRRKSKKFPKMMPQDEQIPTYSPVRSDQGETVLLKEAIKYFEGDFDDDLQTYEVHSP